MDEYVCLWTHEEFADYYETSCGNAFQFTDGGPWQNGFKFCPYCGGKLKLDPGKGDDL